MPRADDEQLKARAVGLAQHRCGFVERRIFVRLDVFDRAGAALDVDGAAHTAAMDQAIVDLPQLLEMRVARQRFDDDVEVTAARQVRSVRSLPP